MVRADLPNRMQLEAISKAYSGDQMALDIDRFHIMRSKHTVTIRLTYCRNLTTVGTTVELKVS